MGKIRVDGAGAIAQQGGKMMDLPWLPAFQDKGNAGALLGPYQVLLEGRYRKKGRDGHMVLINIPVRQDDDIGPVLMGPVHLQEQAVNGPFQRRVLVVGNRDFLHLEPGLSHILDLKQVGFRKDGVLHLKDFAVFRPFFQDVPLLAHIHGGGGHDFLPYCINGRIGNLCKKLFKIIKKGLVLG